MKALSFISVLNMFLKKQIPRQHLIIWHSLQAIIFENIALKSNLLTRIKSMVIFKN